MKIILDDDKRVRFDNFKNGLEIVYYINLIRQYDNLMLCLYIFTAAEATFSFI